VREDGNAWDHFSHDQAPRTYSLGEDGLAGISYKEKKHGLERERSSDGSRYF